MASTNAALKVVNPRLIYCSITGFGQTGPYAHRAGYDFLVQGMGGLMSITGEPECGPVKVGVALSDVIAGFNALAAILAALLKREQTGEGEYIDVALLDCTVAALVNQASTYLVSGTVPGLMGNAHPTIAPYQAFATADGHIILAIGNDGQFQRFCALAGLEAVAADPRFRTNAQRTVNRGTLIPQIAARLRARTSAEWIGLLEAHAVPCGPINRIDQVLADPQVAARKARRVLAHPIAGALPVVANPVRMASHDTTAAKAPPLLGEDTDEVLTGLLALSPTEVSGLRRAGVV
jgi:crotonobetainyl-CoA:carnitine CoA-transferase CaiB-like acyl-CoA transferase